MREVKGILKKISWLFVACLILMGLGGCSEIEATSSALYEQDVEAASVETEEDKRFTVPRASTELEGQQYEEVVNLFLLSGFTNVEATPTEIEYTETQENGSVMSVSIGDDTVFVADAKYEKDVPIYVHYRVILPKPTPTSTPTPTPTSTPTPEPVVNDTVQTTTNEAMVWIPKTGSKYHSNSGCSNMKNPSQVTISEAQSRGYDACKKCY